MISSSTFYLCVLFLLLTYGGLISATDTTGNTRTTTTTNLSTTATSVSTTELTSSSGALAKSLPTTATISPNLSSISKLPSTLKPNFNLSNVLGNLLGVLGQLSNKEQGGKTGENIENFVEGLLTGAANGNQQKADTKNGTSGNDAIMSMLASFLPLLSQSGLTDTSTLVPLVLNFIKSNVAPLKEKGLSETCISDVEMLADGLGESQQWALKMVDALFKIQSNILGYNLKWMGDMEECVAIHAYSYRNATQTWQTFDGKYCRIIIPVPGIPAIGEQYALLGACASNRCSNDDVKILVDAVLDAAAPESFKSRSTISCVEDLTLSGSAIAVICFLAFLGLLVVAGTLYDVIVIQLKCGSSENEEQEVVASSYTVLQKDSIKMAEIHENGGYTVSEVEKGHLPSQNGDVKAKAQNGLQIPNGFASSIVEKKKRGQSRLEKVILSFSVYTNGCKMLGTSQGAGSLGAINGIRFLSMAWVILGHTYFFAMGYTTNMMEFAYKKSNQWTFMGVLYATPAVDSFFALSGTLVAYLTLRELKKVGGVRKLNWIIFYLHRYWRLTPAYMLILLVGAVLYKYFGFGALNPMTDNSFMSNCKTTWWTNLLYVNNLVKPDESCMGWSWYLADDMQMYILSPLILIPFFYNARLGALVSGVFMVGTLTTTAVIAAIHKYPVQVFSPHAPTKQDDTYNRLMYIPFFTRMGPYILGLVTGYMLYRSELKFRIPKVINIACWFLSIGLCTAIIYGPYTDDDSHIMSIKETVVYMSLFRTGWGLAICWFIFACATGNGGWINDVLSWSPFIPLGRMTYCAYLIHPFVIMFYHENRMKETYFTDYDSIYFFLGNLVLSYGLAFVTSLFFESPMMGIEKAVLGKK